MYFMAHTTENYSNGLILNWIHSWLANQPFHSGGRPQPIEHFFVYWQVNRLFSVAALRVIRRIGSHQRVLMLPRCHPHKFVREHFKNPFWAKFLLAIGSAYDFRSY
jgi:hypothetical protein